MATTALFEWDGREYEPSPKSADWYWALGIIATASVIACILFANYLFALLIVAATVSIALHAAKHPPLHHFRVVERGLFIGEEMHLFEHIISFSMLEDIEGKLPPVLSLKTDSWIAPHMMIPLNGVNADALYEFLLHHIDESEHHHALSDVLTALFRF